MNASRLVLAAIALGSFAPEAQAGRDRPSYAVTSKMCMLSGSICHLRVSGPEAANLTAVVASASGDERVSFIASGSRLYGTAPAPLPRTATEAAIWITLYDVRSKPIAEYAGTVSADGALALKATSGRAELLSAEVIEASGGYEVALGLAGAEDVAYGSVTIKGADGAKTSEIAWDELVSVWDAKLGMEHEGPVDVDLRVEDAKGAVLANTHTAVSAPVDDGGYGIGSIPVDEDPLTSLSLIRGKEGARIKQARWNHVAVVSGGWTLGKPLPTHAIVGLADGGTVTIRANSFQRLSREAVRDNPVLNGLVGNPGLRVVIDGGTLTIDEADPTLADLSSPVCAEGTCVTLVQESDGYALAVTQYRWDTAFASDSVTIELSALDASGKVLSTHKSVAKFDDDVSVVFAQEVEIVGDAVGGGLSGSVRLVEEGSSRPLAQGKFYGMLTRDDGGDLDLGGAGVSDVVALEPGFSVLIGSAPSPCGNDDDGWGWPPPVLGVAGNGSGTKNATTTTSARPELL